MFARATTVRWYKRLVASWAPKRVICITRSLSIFPVDRYTNEVLLPLGLSGILGTWWRCHSWIGSSGWQMHPCVHLGSRVRRIYPLSMFSIQVVDVFTWYHLQKGGANALLYGPAEWPTEFFPSTSCRLHRSQAYESDGCQLPRSNACCCPAGASGIVPKGQHSPFGGFPSLSILLLHGIHLFLQGDNQGMIVRHLTRDLHHGCWDLIFKGSYGGHAKPVGCLPQWWYYLVGYKGVVSICRHWW